MNIKETLQEIWDKDYINNLPEQIKSRGYVFAENTKQKDILITGINPSFREGDKNGSYSFNLETDLKTEREKFDSYWTPIRKLIYDKKVDHRKDVAHIDMFYHREQNQSFIRNVLLKSQEGIQFLTDQLNLTQHTIEDVIKPKVIIVKNKESAMYWGLYPKKNNVWMGYIFEYLGCSVAGELFKITGLLDLPYRIAPEIKKTNLIGTLVLFSKYSRYVRTEDRTTPQQLQMLLEYYNTKQIPQGLFKDRN